MPDNPAQWFLWTFYTAGSFCGLVWAANKVSNRLRAALAPTPNKKGG